MPREPKTQAMPVRNWQAELAAETQAAKNTEDSAAGGGSWISLKGGRITIDGAEAVGNQIEVVVVDHVLENQYYDKDYDPNVPASPVCYAFGRLSDDLAPHADCPEPQADACKGCPMSEWSSAAKGKGKACKEVRRLAVISADEINDIAGAEVRFLKVPVMSCKNWTGYVRHCADVLHLPPLGVVTQISTVPDTKSQFRVQFKFVEKVPEQHLGELLDKKKQIQPDLTRGYPVVEAPPPPPPRGARKFQK